MALQRTRRPRFRSGRSLRSLGSPLNARLLGATRIRVAVGLLFFSLVSAFVSGDDSSSIKKALAKYENSHPGALRVGGEVKAPKLVHRVAPDFGSLPPEKQTYSGRPIMVYAVISTTGNVVDPVIVSSPQPHLDAVVLRAMREWTYQPARRRGKPVPVLLVTTVMF